MPKQLGQRFEPLQYGHLPPCIVPLPAHALQFLLPPHSPHGFATVSSSRLIRVSLAVPVPWGLRLPTCGFPVPPVLGAPVVRMIISGGGGCFEGCGPPALRHAHTAMIIGGSGLSRLDAVLSCVATGCPRWSPRTGRESRLAPSQDSALRRDVSMARRLQRKGASAENPSCSVVRRAATCGSPRQPAREAWARCLREVDYSHYAASRRGLCGADLEWSLEELQLADRLSRSGDVVRSSAVVGNNINKQYRKADFPTGANLRHTAITDGTRGAASRQALT